MLRGAAFRDADRRLDLLYAIEDPWEMASEREQHRFSETMRRLADIAPRFGTILEIGSGEGHQSLLLQDVTDRLCGLEVSARAAARARARLPGARFEVGGVDDVARLFPGMRFDLVTACEVLYYMRDVAAAVQALQEAGDRLFVTAYRARAEAMESHFRGTGWRELAPIRHGDTEWRCYLWERGSPDAGPGGSSG